ncbi:hypothetical protein VF14_18490 [Nostoc linckia z18]|uniref:Uncharacterized protein n=2 Tax=Nostoc linckia TaxID=92942 RepID=A0A9Q5Z990_NOSLI|nr:hypothetical protein [Nostoc linckia]PHJ52437.1 hypothetical protein VF02_37600 [Nostoc linckia z1]PHJ82008.1 hypothetical protein VF07_29405 [Nostoc linckia z6]PHJ83745.1 hypothetical protein VF04_36605 [Nostoc linckia z7]PHK00827.1 hypothetical protein VF08_23485 [Nostoc linckia z8]PHK09353.1 hypothetical protein VF09_16185 [Nostoc linckia z9]
MKKKYATADQNPLVFLRHNLLEDGRKMTQPAAAARYGVALRTWAWWEQHGLPDNPSPANASAIALIRQDLEVLQGLTTLLQRVRAGIGHGVQRRTGTPAPAGIDKTPPERQ